MHKLSTTITAVDLANFFEFISMIADYYLGKLIYLLYFIVMLPGILVCSKNW